MRIVYPGGWRVGIVYTLYIHHGRVVGSTRTPSLPPPCLPGWCIAQHTPPYTKPHGYIGFKGAQRLLLSSLRINVKRRLRILGEVFLTVMPPFTLFLGDLPGFLARFTPFEQE